MNLRHDWIPTAHSARVALPGSLPLMSQPGARVATGDMSPEARTRARIGNPHPAVVFMAAGIAVAGALAPAVVGTARSPAPALVRVSSDPIIKAGQEHATEAEPDTIAVGHSVLSSFMVGNVPTCTDDIGWAFSSDGGKTWAHGLLPGLTPYSTPPGPEKSVADTTDSWDAKYKQWVVSALNCTGAGGVTVSTSTNGTHWSNPISVFKGTGRDIADKDWVTCDSHPASPHYGNCYAEWDMVNKGFLVEMSTSTDGGKTWSAPVTTASKFEGVGGEPTVLPNGTVVVPIPALHGLALHDGNLDVFTSTNGGQSWGPTRTITTFHQHRLAGNLQNLRLPFFPAEGMDSAGRVYLAFPDCRFRTRCASDDMVMTTSTNGTHWTAVTRIPIAPVTSTLDVWGGGLAVDPSTSGTSARLGLYYYYFPKVPCTVSTCQVFLGYTSSADGGASWSTPQVIAGPMKLTQFGDPYQGGKHVGGFAGDYVGASAIPGGNAVAVLPLGLPPTTQKFNEPMETVAGGEPIKAQSP
jgi:hypothetical protein